MPESTDFDHVAVASEHAIDNLWRYRAELGGTYLGGGTDPGFHFHQVAFASGMKIELLQDDPDHPEDFLRRFLDRNGPGPHHLTFKVPDIGVALRRVEAAGYTPVGIDIDDPVWQQAFIHPGEGPGIVIQVAATNGEGFTDEPADELPPPRRPPADLTAVVLLVADLEGATSLFGDTLEGTPVAGGHDELGRFAEFVWPGGGRLRVVAPESTTARHRLGRRPGRLHHLEFTGGDPVGLPGLERCADGTLELPPEHNLGVRLRFR
ncbi:MAG: hypothetical protein D6683_17135 [Actinomyces sp.]|nr:MAG: hypothetical protein D6683_17135 [Actinomyces sp.]